PRTRLHGSHQAQLKRMSAMLAQHANPAKIARIEDVSGWNDTGEGDRLGSAKRKPPVPLIEFGNGSGVKECQLMKFRQRVRNVIIIPVDLANPIHPPHLNSSSSLVFRHVRRSFAECRLDAEPHGPDEAGHDHRDDCLECVALRLLDASAPASKMLKVRAQLFSILFVDSE